MQLIESPNHFPISRVKDYFEREFGSTAVHTSEGPSSETILLILAPYNQRKPGETAHKVLYKINPKLGQQEELLDKFTNKIIIIPVDGKPLLESKVKQLEQELTELN